MKRADVWDYLESSSSSYWSSDEEEEGMVVNPPVPPAPPPFKKSRIHRPLMPEWPKEASVLYALLVPHGNPHGIDAGMVFAVDILVMMTINPNGWYRHEEQYRAMQWRLDVLQLAHTCKHAFAWLKTRDMADYIQRYTSGFLTNEFGSAWHACLSKDQAREFYAAMGLEVRLYKDFFFDSIPERSLYKRALIAAYLDRVAVAKWLAPPGLVMDYEAMRRLSPFSSVADRPLLWPKDMVFFLPAGAVANRERQKFMWLRVALQLRPNKVARKWLRKAPRYDKVLAWTDYPFGDSPAIMLAQEIARKFYWDAEDGGAIFPVEKRIAARVEALAEYDRRMAEMEEKEKKVAVVDKSD